MAQKDAGTNPALTMVNAGFFHGQGFLDSLSTTIPSFMRFASFFLLLLAPHFLAGNTPAGLHWPPDDSPCRSDFDGDGWVGMDDVLILLTDFGAACEEVPPEPLDWAIIQFSELHYNPSTEQGSDNDHEFLELHNPGAATVDLSGWSLTDGLEVTFPEGTTIAPHGFLVLTTAPTTYSGLGYPVLDWGAGGLNNSGETIVLRAPDGSVVEFVTWSDSGDWDSAPDGAGPSLERLHLDWPAEQPGAWSASIGIGGTPGAINSLWVD